VEASPREGRGTSEMVLIAAGRAKAAGLHKATFWLAMKRAGVPEEQIRRAVRATWEALHAETPEGALRKMPSEKTPMERSTKPFERLSAERWRKVLSEVRRRLLEDQRLRQQFLPEPRLESRPARRPTVE